MMKTEYEIIGVDSIAKTGKIEWPKAPDFVMIRDFVEPLIQTKGQPQAYIEHVRVWHAGEYCSMFVDDMGQLKNLPINEAATLIYNANLKQHDPELAASLGESPIHGPAVLFHRNVWA